MNVRIPVALLAAAALGIATPMTATAATPRTAAPQNTIVVNRNVTFSGGVPVGGWTSLTLNRNGTYNWSGHMHDSGGTSYNYSGVCVVRFSSGTAFVFETRGRVHGTFDSGSRDYNWNKSGYNRALPSVWNASSSYRWTCKNRTTLNLAGVVDSALAAVGYAARVVAIVA
ncbi:hypothetical protein [Streptomyces sp. T028]|uniref:hypothetical protein n=1 Tax=Streptomyces sp. T028 TaxID=3394379 RepID=UPI003A875184